MNKQDAKRIAETITNEQLKQMFDNAKAKIKDWTVTADVNKGMTKGAAWNILTKAFDINKEYHILVKTNMVWEFGDYLPGNLKPIKEKKAISENNPFHQEPIF